MQTLENQNKPDYSLPELPAPTNLKVRQRRIIPRAVFWPVFILFFLVAAGSTLAYFDRRVWHQNLDELLPATTSMLVVLPTGDGNSQFRQFKKLLERLPANSDILNINLDAAAASDADISKLYEFWRTYKDVLGPTIAFAKVDGGSVIYADVRGSIGRRTDQFYLWQSGRKLYASENPEVLKRISAIRQASQITRPGYWLSKRERPKALKSSPRYQQSFKKLTQPLLAGVYLNGYADSFRDLNKTAGRAVTLPKIFGGMLGDIKFASAEALALGVRAESRGLFLRAVSVKESGPRSSFELLGIPSKIAGENIDASWQINNIASYGPILRTLAARYGLKLELGKFSGRVAVFASLKSGLFGILAQDLSPAALEDFGSQILPTVKFFAPGAQYAIRGNFLAVSNKPEAARDILDNALSAQSSSTKLDSYFYLSTPGAVGLLERAASASSDVLLAWEILAKSLPELRVSSSRDGAAAVTDWFLRVDELSAKDRVAAEKVFERLAAGKKDGLQLSEVKDASRRADLAILQNAISEFSGKNKRAPDSLRELVPIFLASVPLDPGSGAPYLYKNTGANLSFFLEIRYDNSQAYCLTSKGVKLKEPAGCKEE